MISGERDAILVDPQFLLSEAHGVAAMILEIDFMKKYMQDWDKAVASKTADELRAQMKVPGARHGEPAQQRRHGRVSARPRPVAASGIPISPSSLWASAACRPAVLPVSRPSLVPLVRATSGEGGLIRRVFNSPPCRPDRER